MTDLSPDTKLSMDWRGEMVLIGIIRPQMFNRIHPDGFYILAVPTTISPTTRRFVQAVLSGHSANFSRRNNVDAFPLHQWTQRRSLWARGKATD
jgi:enoyl-CoA hydratase